MAKQNYSDKEKELVMSKIFDRIANKESIRFACENESISKKTYLLWISKSDHYAHMHARAMEERAECIFEEMINIADTPVEGEVIKETENGVEVTKSDMIQHRKLQIDTRKWMLSKMQPKKYGDKLDVTSDGEKISDNKIQIEIVE